MFQKRFALVHLASGCYRSPFRQPILRQVATTPGSVQPILHRYRYRYRYRFRQQIPSDSFCARRCLNHFRGRRLYIARWTWRCSAPCGLAQAEQMILEKLVNNCRGAALAGFIQRRFRRGRCEVLGQFIGFGSHLFDEFLNLHII